MNLHVFQHVPYEGPAALQEWADLNKHSVSISNFYEKTTLPNPQQVGLLIVLGGPMGVYEEGRYPWLKKEKAYLKNYIERGGKILGICLGAQLIAKAMGAEVYPHTQKEIGWYPVEWSPELREHSRYGFLPDKQPVLHWHGDTFDIPERAINIGQSTACKRQGFLMRDNILALQFHLEMTRKSLQMLAENSEDELAKGGKFVQTSSELLDRDHPFRQCNQTLFTLLDNFVGESQ
ncbi:MAG: hypothetical protein U5K69_03555 [Balneolaceae bacterium]|nr:hypothetical protein [Balneolaceae bacterium]